MASHHGRRIMCRPLVSTMVDHFSHAFGVPNQLIMTEYDVRTGAALTRLVAALPPNAAHLLLGQPDEALAERELSWRNVLSGVEEAMQDQPTPSLRHARGITPDDGDGDDEHSLARKRLKIQALITACVDTSVQSGLLQIHEQEGSWGARARLHTWMWRLNPHHGAVMEPEECRLGPPARTAP